MTWGNAWAWAGLVTLALPVLIHLLSRGHARVQRFPTLRFLEASRLLPTRRTRLHDLLLLAVRASILAAAVIALAQPALRTANRSRAVGRTLVRAIVLDTSASMERATTSGGRAVDSARAMARRIAGEAQASMLIETRFPPRAIAGAVEWLNTQTGRGELVVVSDFQRGTLSAADLAIVPPTVGVRLQRILVREPTLPVDLIARSGHDDVIARTTLTPQSTNVEWSLRRSAVHTSNDQLSLLAGPSEGVRADASRRAAETFAVRAPLDSAHAIAIVYPQFAQRADLLRTASVPAARWATEIVARLHADSILAVSSMSAVAAISTTGGDTTRGLVVARTIAGKPTVVAMQDSSDGAQRLLLFSFVDAGSLTSAALITAVNGARSLATPLSELEPSTLSDATLAALRREPAVEAAARNSTNRTAGASDGRWLWLLALLLLALETWMRRALPPASLSRPRLDANERAA